VVIPGRLVPILAAHKLAAGTEDITDFAGALDAENDRHAGRRIPDQSNPKLATYRDRALFGEQVERWMATFGRERVHVIVFEDMVADPVGEFRKTLEFLGIDPDYKPESFAAHNVAHGARSPLLRRVFNSRPVQWVAWKALPRLIGDTRTRALVRRVSQSGLQRRPITREKVDPALRRSLEEYYAADVGRLSQLLGRDMAAFWFSGG